MSRGLLTDRIKRVLLVEDNAIIAMDLEFALRDLGIAEIDVAGSNEQALALIAQQEFTVALVDLFLDQETCQPVMAALAARGIPFALVTGYEDPVGFVDLLPDVPVLEKPVMGTDLALVLDKLC